MMSWFPKIDLSWVKSSWFYDYDTVIHPTHWILGIIAGVSLATMLWMLTEMFIESHRKEGE